MALKDVTAEDARRVFAYEFSGTPPEWDAIRLVQRLYELGLTPVEVSQVLMITAQSRCESYCNYPGL